ncbi:MAG: polysaccharide lyase [Hyphomicrobium sp.]
MKFDANKFLFNAAGVLIGLVAVGYAVNDFFTVETTKICASRYKVSTLLPLQNSSGALLSPIELQAMAGAREYGMLERAKVVAASGAPSPAVLEITLPKGESRSQREASREQSGIGMRWTPKEIAGATSACLTYSAFMPSDFEFGDGGILPGIYGGSRFDGAERGEHKPGFVVRAGWREKAVGDVTVQLPKIADKVAASLGADRFQFSRGRWVQIEQEVVLNTPGRADGKYRLWVDGGMRIERDNLQWRDEASTTIEGVAGNVGFGTVEKPGQSPRTSQVRLTPFELRWM